MVDEKKQGIRKHKCRNPKYCPYCARKIRDKVIKFYDKNPHIIASTSSIAKNFDIKHRLAQKILLQLYRRKKLRRYYLYNKRLTIGKGVQTLYCKNIDYARLK